METTSEEIQKKIFQSIENHTCTMRIKHDMVMEIPAEKADVLCHVVRNRQMTDRFTLIGYATDHKATRLYAIKGKKKVALVLQHDFRTKASIIVEDDAELLKEFHKTSKSYGLEIQFHPVYTMNEENAGEMGRALAQSIIFGISGQRCRFI